MEKRWNRNSPEEEDDLDLSADDEDGFDDEEYGVSVDDDSPDLDPSDEDVFADGAEEPEISDEPEAAEDETP